MGILYIVATPIGNLEDITLRALRILGEIDLILAENPTTTQKLLLRYNLQKPIFPYHQHTKKEIEEKIISLLLEGKNIALVSEAGTPGISDPGGKLIEKIVEKLGEKAKIVPIPGPSAITSAASISGFWMDKFLFLGFCPKKKKRKKFFEEVLNSKYPVIFYESRYRILKTLKELKDLFERKNQKKRKVVVCRELTKQFETIYRGFIDEIIEKIEKDPIKGEFVVIIDRRKK